MTADQIAKLVEVRGFMCELGNAVRTERETRRLSLRAVARQVGIDHVQLSRVEHGVWVLDVDETARLREWMAS